MIIFSKKIDITVCLITIILAIGIVFKGKAGNTSEVGYTGGMIIYGAQARLYGISLIIFCVWWLFSIIRKK